MSAIRMLTPFELEKYRDHLLRLGAEDRRLRFGTFADDARIAAFTDGIDRRRTRVLALLGPNLEVVAAVQIAVFRGRAVELAFSVDPAYRRRGVGTALMNRALLWARNRGLARAHVQCLTENIAMRRLARGAGMEMTTEAGETEAVMALPAATPLSWVAEALAEGVGLVDLAAKTNCRALERLGSPTMSQGSLPAVC
jgi:RimJ/RimL family protein N-acetyltransferase